MLCCVLSEDIDMEYVGMMVGFADGMDMIGGIFELYGVYE